MSTRQFTTLASLRHVTSPKKPHLAKNAVPRECVTSTKKGNFAKKASLRQCLNLPKNTSEIS